MTIAISALGYACVHESGLWQWDVRSTDACHMLVSHDVRASTHWSQHSTDVL